MAAPVYIALLHYPIMDRLGQTVTTAVTNLDIHDIARSARTYGVRRYYLVTPIHDQHDMVERIFEHWQSSQSGQYHPDRSEAISRAELAHTFDDVLQRIEAREGAVPEVVFTDAREYEGRVSYVNYRKELARPDRSRPALIVFGTGWGISPDFLSRVDLVLDPVWGPEGPSGYNHLSVRAAAAIILDRLLGT